jgi:AraC family transcriptional regulator, L-rhamnose operon transcriptional activator RhaR
MSNLFYYDNGELYFKTETPIFINMYEEPSETHLHAHNFIEIAYVYSGEGVHKIGDREYKVKKGDLFLINFDTPHEFRSLPETFHVNPLTVYNCVFKPEFINSSFHESKNFYDIADYLMFRSFFPNEAGTLIDIKLVLKNTSDIEECYKKMYYEYQEKEVGYIELLKSYVTELLIIIFRAFRKSGHISDDTQNSNSKIIEKIIKHLKTNYNYSLNLQDLSMVVFLSPNYISKLFKDFTGHTIRDFIQKTRIEEACRLLKQTDRKILDISHEVGYKDLTHFLEVFKKMTGKSPGVYRKDH